MDLDKIWKEGFTHLTLLGWGGLTFNFLCLVLVGWFGVVAKLARS